MTIQNLLDWLQEAEDNNTWMVSTQSVKLHLEEIQKEQLRIGDVSNFVLLAKPNYKAKDGTIKRGIEIDGKYYAPKKDC